MFRDGSVGLNGEADFYSANLEGLKREGKTSLEAFLEVCMEKRSVPRSRCDVLTCGSIPKCPRPPQLPIRFGKE